MPVLAALLVLLQLVLFIGLPLVTLHLLSRPLRMRSNKSHARRLLIIDFVALAVQLQGLLALALPLIRLDDARSGRAGQYQFDDLVGLIPCCALAALAMWWAGVEAASRANLSAWQRRLVVHLILVPGMVTVAVLSDACLIMAAYVFTNRFAEPGIINLMLLVPATLTGGAIVYLIAWWICRAPLSRQSNRLPLSAAAKP